MGTRKLPWACGGIEWILNLGTQPLGDPSYHRARVLPALPAQALIKPPPDPLNPRALFTPRWGRFTRHLPRIPTVSRPLISRKFPGLSRLYRQFVAITFDGSGTAVHCTESRSFTLWVFSALSLQSIKYCTILWVPPTLPSSHPPTNPSFNYCIHYTVMLDHLPTPKMHDKKVSKFLIQKWAMAILLPPPAL